MTQNQAQSLVRVFKTLCQDSYDQEYAIEELQRLFPKIGWHDSFLGHCPHCGEKGDRYYDSICGDCRPKYPPTKFLLSEADQILKEIFGSVAPDASSFLKEIE
jgi:hypothetical protein